jgi:dephospho-CoA kinase
MRKRIAVTGGIGSGKSLALQRIAELGYPIYSCDEIYKNVIKSKAYIRQIEGVFPSCIVNGEIDRRKLSELVFAGEENLAKLNAIAHPLIMKELFSKMDEDKGLVFAEVPLLFEGGFENLFDCVIVIKRNLRERINATMKRDGLDESAIKKRIGSQFDYDTKEGLTRMKNCNAILLENNGTEQELKRALEQTLISLEKDLL